VDAEGCFFIWIRSDNTATFRFLLGFHINELPLLNNLKNIFNCSSITVSKTACFFEITSKKDIQNIIIPIFEYFPLNSTKYLDYQDFKKAFEIYTSENYSKDDDLIKIKFLKSNMNKARKLNNFNKIVHITPSWLLGFS